MSFFANRISHLVKIKSLCVICSAYHNDKSAVCQRCHTLFEPLGPHCKICAHPLTQKDDKLCGQCVKNKQFLDASFIPYIYQEPLRSLMHRYKYEQALELTHTLSNLMIHALHPEILESSCLMAVPMHATRLKERGFNHAHMLAQYLSKKTRIPLDIISLKKNMHTPTQMSLDAKERAQNIKGVFSFKPTSYSCVTLVDDLLTTGSTAFELARILKAGGVKKVLMWCCARTPKDF